MKIFGLLLSAVLFTSPATFADTKACLSVDEARTILSTYLNDPMKQDAWTTFDSKFLVEDLKMWEGHYHSQTDYKVKSDEGYHEFGTVYASVYCDGKMYLVFSKYHPEN